MKRIFTVIALVVLNIGLIAQSTPEKKNKPLKFNLNEDGSHWIKGTFMTQVWVRYTETNPGTTLFGEPVGNIFDIGLRRTRLQLFGQISDRIFVYTQFGVNNLNHTTTKYYGAFFHDALIEYKIKERAISIGGGLTGWSGSSRYASPSVGSIMSLDAPLYQQATVNISDQFVRKLSIYAKGKIAKLDYRVALSKPMAVQNATKTIHPLSDVSDYSLKPAKLQYQGYFMWQFLDEESNMTPYTTGTYIGTKSVFNIGAGLIYQPDAMWHLAGTDTISTAMMQLGVDVFYDAPLNKEKGNALTVYAAYNYFDFGPNYTRNVGVMNPANGTDTKGTFSGAGNSFTMIGTGSTIYAQVGYLFKKDLLPKGVLQPYLASQISMYDRLNGTMMMYEAGFNWFINSTHGQKLSFNYQNRPVFDFDSNGEISQSMRKGMFVVQFQVSI